jgi:hypothetical protein
MMMVSFVSAHPGQESADYLTTEEADLVREAQRIDQRVKVFLKIAERRLMLAENPEATQTKKDEAIWGSLPKGSRAEMLQQYARATDEIIVNVEDAYERQAPLDQMIKALTIFREETDKHLVRLEALRAKLTDEATRQVLEQTVDDLKLASDDARQSEAEFKVKQERQKEQQKKKKT